MKRIFWSIVYLYLLLIWFPSLAHAQSFITGGQSHGAVAVKNVWALGGCTCGVYCQCYAPPNDCGCGMHPNAKSVHELPGTDWQPRSAGWLYSPLKNLWYNQQTRQYHFDVPVQPVISYAPPPSGMGFSGGGGRRGGGC